MPTDIRQSSLFARFMQDIGWNVEKINNQFVYLRTFPLVGVFAKMPRPKPPFFPPQRGSRPDVGTFSQFLQFVKHNHIFRLKIAPFVSLSEKKSGEIKKRFLTNHFKIDYFPFNPTTTILIDLTQKEEKLFQNFTSAKRRAVRRALKNGITVKESSDINMFISIRGKQYFPFGFLVRNEMEKLWKNFAPENTVLLLASSKEGKKLAGILLLLYDKVAYYWFASSLSSGKKLFAPTLLVWEALKCAKKRGCSQFDFEGIYDDRFPKAAASWRGFTKFKEGFGGKKVVYMENFYI